MSKTMQAAVYHGPNDIRYEDVSYPELGPGDLIIKVLNANICGTDLRILHGGHRHYPEGTIRIPGHEVVGEIVAVGEKNQKYKLGERVFIAPNMGEGDSRETISGNNNLDPNFKAIGINMDGAFAEYMLIPEAAVSQGNVMPVSESEDPAVAALIEPLACVLRGQNAVKVKSGDILVVMGAGPIGMLHVLLAKARGAAKVIVSEPSLIVAPSIFLPLDSNQLFRSSTNFLKSARGFWRSIIRKAGVRIIRQRASRNAATSAETG